MDKNREEALYQKASLGQKFEFWVENDATKALMSSLEEDAETARDRCARLSPFTEQQQLADAQAEVMAYELALKKIRRFIHEGMEAREELEHPEPFID